MKVNVDFVGVETKDVKPHIDKNRKRLMDIWVPNVFKWKLHFVTAIFFTRSMLPSFGIFRSVQVTGLTFPRVRAATPGAECLYFNRRRAQHRLPKCFPCVKCFKKWSEAC